MSANIFVALCWYCYPEALLPVIYTVSENSWDCRIAMVIWFCSAFFYPSFGEYENLCKSDYLWWVTWVEYNIAVQSIMWMRLSPTFVLFLCVCCALCSWMESIWNEIWIDPKWTHSRPIPFPQTTSDEHISYRKKESMQSPRKREREDRSYFNRLNCQSTMENRWESFFKFFKANICQVIRNMGANIGIEINDNSTIKLFNHPLKTEIEYVHCATCKMLQWIILRNSLNTSRNFQLWYQPYQYGERIHYKFVWIKFVS